MENILEINKYDEYDYSNIKLSNPTIQTGNNYYTNITIGERDKPLYIQFPKCNTKAGYVKNNSKCYTDLLFLASDTKIIKWLENFEIFLQNEIYNKRDIWFDSELILDDIQELMTPIMRSYKSGKNVLIRCNIKNHKCSVYDENEILQNLESFTSDKEIIPLVSVNGIKFSSKNFIIELNLSQIMIISSKDDLEKSCLIKSTTLKSLNNSNKNNLEDSTYLDENIQNTDVENTHVENTDVENTDTQSNSLLDIDNSINKNTLDNLDDIKNDNIILNISDINNDKKVDNCDINQENIEILNEIDLDSIKISQNKDEQSEINIREPQEIYYELYRNALQKAIDLKKNTVEAFLKAKNIKLKYNLEELDLENNYDEDIENLNY